MLNKRGGWKNVQELIKGEVLMRMSRVEKVSKINKQDTPYIRQVRVRCFLFFSGDSTFQSGIIILTDWQIVLSKHQIFPIS